MQYNGLLLSLPREIKLFLSAFVVVLSIGYLTGLLFVGQTNSFTPQGVEENYLGNEDSTEAVEIMRFEKSDREMLTILHTHILSISFIFFLLGLILIITKLPVRLKVFLLVEPFFSIIITFGGIYLMWKGMLWMKYIVIISGSLMTLVYVVSASIILYQLLIKKN